MARTIRSARRFHFHYIQRVFQAQQQRAVAVAPSTFYFESIAAAFEAILAKIPYTVNRMVL